MTPKYQLTITSFETVDELPSTWPNEACLALLKQLEFADSESVEPNQLRDYAVMALQDLEIAEAAHALLDQAFGDKLPKGKKQNIAEDMQREPLWEEYPDLAYHEPIFNIQRLFNLAFEETPKPEVNRLQITLAPENPASEAYLSDILKSPKPEAFIVRCLTAALPDDSIVNRLFEDQIKGAEFPEAEHIVWHIQSDQTEKDSKGRQGYSLTLYSPQRWSNELEDAPQVICEPYLDKEEDAD